MAYQSMWYFTDLPKDVVEILERDLIEKYDDEMEESRLVGDRLNKDKRFKKLFDLIRNRTKPDTEEVIEKKLNVIENSGIDFREKWNGFSAKIRVSGVGQFLT